ncbi:MAG: transporter substrate-binding domain-containing protein [Motiliproteus sp.]
MCSRFITSLLLILISGLALGETFRVGVPATDQAPFIWREHNEFKGIYPDIIELLAAEMGVQMILVPLPQARLLKHFSIGVIDLEPGVSQRRSDSDELQGVSLYSLPFMTVNEVIIYRPTLSFPVFILQDLGDKRVATVRGATVPDYIRRDDLSNELQIAQRVHRGWNDIGLMKEALALHYLRTLNLNYQISLPYETNPVVFRLHRHQQEWLEPMNQAVSRLKERGAIEELICKYLCGRG